MASTANGLAEASYGEPNPLAPILAVDCRPLVRAGLARLAGGALECPVEAVADLAAAGVAINAIGSVPRAVLLGVRRDENPAPLIAEAMQLGAPVICALDDDSPAVAHSALVAGAAGYLVIEAAEGEALRATLRGIEAGEPALPPGDASAGDGGAGRVATVTERSLEVLGSLADGLHDHEIAARLGISTSSVRKHIASAQTRLRARTRTQAVAMATREGLL
jgi:two-component system, NarL family, response regulator DesR